MVVVLVVHMRSLVELLDREVGGPGHPEVRDAVDHEIGVVDADERLRLDTMCRLVRTGPADHDAADGQPEVDELLARRDDDVLAGPITEIEMLGGGHEGAMPFCEPSAYQKMGLLHIQAMTHRRALKSSIEWLARTRNNDMLRPGSHLSRRSHTVALEPSQGQLWTLYNVAR